MSRGRPQKVADMIQRELSDLLRRDVRDPRVGMVTITSVDVSPDLSHAKVFFTTLDKEHLEETTRDFILKQLAQETVRTAVGQRLLRNRVVVSKL